ncbi:MAG: hypothetical protein BWX50_01629 [Euryarchaeota archaeon ADurb.Bin009]|nr:MAG: hypothetical protein BWX50_01629 [Euryarchaeota archaeon ADurb.Bin009]
MIIAPHTAGLCEERDDLRHQEEVYAGDGHVHRGIVREDGIDDTPVRLVDRERKLRGIHLRGIVVRIYLKEDEVVDPGFEPREVDLLLLKRHVVVGKRADGEIETVIEAAGTVLDPAVHGLDADIGKCVADGLFRKGDHCRRRVDEEDLTDPGDPAGL